MHQGGRVKENLQRGILFLTLSLVLSSTYLNCAGNNMDPIGNSSSTNNSSLDTDHQTCANGAANAPLCTVNFFGNCINGNTSPPDCGTGGTFSSCNGELLLDDPNCNKELNVFVSYSGPLSKYNLQIKMNFNPADNDKSGAIFFVAQKPKPENKAELLTLFCTNPCNDNSWKEWNGDSTVDWSVSGLKPQIGALGLQAVYNKIGDFTSLGGFKILVGYGVGSSVGASVSEMLNYRSVAYPQGRFIEALRISEQNMSFSFSGPSGGSYGSLKNYDLWVSIAPSSVDYSLAGYLFVIAQDPSGQVHKAYRFNSATSAYEWVDWDGNSNSLGDKFLKYDSAIKNEFFSIYKGDATGYKDWKLYVGYGIGSNAVGAGNDCINNKKFNEKNPFIIK